MNIYAISDIHGQLDLLKEAVGQIDLHHDILVLCGDYIDGGNHSYQTLVYIRSLQQKYLDHVIVLKGNHEQWLISWLNHQRVLDIDIHPSTELIIEIVGEEFFDRCYQQAMERYNHVAMINDYIDKKCQEYIQNQMSDFYHWLLSLTLYYETENQIFVHAGIEEIDGANEYWKEVSDENIYLMKSDIEREYFYKDVIAGHMSTSYIKDDVSFYDICCCGNHYYIDSFIQQSHQVNILKYDTKTCIYTQLKKVQDTWKEIEIIKDESL